MDLRSDSESKSGSERLDPNRPDYEESSNDEEPEAEGSAAGATEEGSVMPTGKINAEPTKTDATDESAVVAKGAVPGAATTQRQHNQSEGKREPTGKEPEKKKAPVPKATPVVDPKSPEAPLGGGARQLPPSP
jgi:hypothetical protein